MIRRSSQIHIVMFDTNPLLAEGLCALLNSADGYLAQSVVLHEDGIPELPVGPTPNIVLVDPTQVSQSPVEIVTQLSEIGSNGALVGYCANASVDIARDFLSVGFRGFLSKTSSFTTLCAALDVVIAGGVYLDAAFAPALLGSASYVVDQNTGTKPLSDREFVVLKSVALGMSMKEIGTAMDLSSKTVETYKARASSKLKLQGRREIVDFAIRNGWVQTAV
jgi:two-component system, NarL family, nitrate/nitrite response regulator NarL